MSWRIEFAPDVEGDVAQAACWYEERRSGFGADFVEEIIRVWDALADNPLLNCRQHPTKNVRWRYPKRFPFRVVYEVDEAKQIVRVVAVLHAARDDRHWKKRV